MNKDLCIKVYPAGGLENRPLLERHLRVEDSLFILYAKIIETLQYLFGENSIITFNYY